jgi:hypothetical protein
MNAVLVVGVYLIDREHTAAHVSAELARSTDWTVTQRWIGLGRGPVPAELAAVTSSTTATPTPKFVLLNGLLAPASLAGFDYVLVCDDDVRLPPGFLDAYLRRVVQYDFALSQPARTHNSYIDHPFVEQLDGLDARWTRFVEIGPVFAMRRDAAPLLLPFDEQSSMGWGYDLVWPRVLEDAGLKLGIVDAVPVDHSLRKPVSYYEHSAASAEMDRYLSGRPHLPKGAAWFIVQSYA